MSAQTRENEAMEIEGDIQIEVLVLAKAIDNCAEGFHAIAGAINRLADATAGEELSDDHELGYLDGKG